MTTTKAVASQKSKNKTTNKAKALKISMLVFAILGTLLAVISYALLSSGALEPNHAKGFMSLSQTDKMGVAKDLNKIWWENYKGNSSYVYHPLNDTTFTNVAMWENIVPNVTPWLAIPFVSVIFFIVYMSLSIVYWKKIEKSAGTIANIVLSVIMTLLSIALVSMVFLLGTWSDDMQQTRIVQKDGWKDIANKWKWDYKKVQLIDFVKTHKSGDLIIRDFLENTALREKIQDPSRETMFKGLMIGAMLPFIIVLLTNLLFVTFNPFKIKTNTPEELAAKKAKIDPETRERKNKINIFAIAITTIILAVITLSVFGDGWLNGTLGKDVYKTGTYFAIDLVNPNAGYMIVSVLLSFITLIFSLTLLGLITEYYRKCKKTKLGLYGIITTTLFIILLVIPLIILSFDYVTETSLQAFNSNFNNNKQASTKELGAFITAYLALLTLLKVYSAFFIIPIIVYIVIQGINLFTSKTIMGEFKSEKNNHKNTYTKGLHKLFQVSITPLILGAMSLILIIFAPFVVVLLTRLNGNNPAEPISYMAIFLMVLMPIMITSFVFKIISIIKAFKLSSLSGYDDARDGSSTGMIKIFSIFNFFGIVLPILTYLSIKRTSQTKAPQAATPKEEPVQVNEPQPEPTKEETVQTNEAQPTNIVEEGKPEHETLKQKITKLKHLLEEEIITQEEFDSMRLKLVNESMA